MSWHERRHEINIETFIHAGRGFRIHADVEQGKWDVRILQESWQQYEIALMDLPDKPLVIDLGAHIGGFTARVKKLYPLAHIIAVEPDRNNLDLLKWNTSHYQGVEIVSDAVLHDYRFASIYSLGENTGAHMVIGIASDTYIEGAVFCVGLDSIVGFLPVVDLLKIDVEGSEYNIFKHFKAWHRIKRIVGEYHGTLEKFNQDARPYLEPHYHIVHYPPYNQHLGFFYAISKNAN